MSVLNYAKEHPLATGAIVIIGGILFILIVRGGGSSNGPTVAGPSDAQIASSTAIEVAKISAASEAAQAGAAVSAAQIGAGVQMNSDKLQAEAVMRQLDVYRDIGLAQIGAESSAIQATLANQQAKTAAIIGSLGSVKKKRRDDVLQALATGQPYYPDNSGNDFATSIGAVSNLIGAVNPLGFM